MNNPTVEAKAKELAEQLSHSTPRALWESILAAALAACAREATNPLCDALREINSLQHQMAIELDPIPQQPRIEYWTRKIEDVAVRALERAVGEKGKA